MNDEIITNNENPENKSSTRQKAQRIGLLALVVSGLFSTLLTVSLFTQASVDQGILNDIAGYSDTSSSPAVPDTSWVPAGYTLFDSQDGIAYMWSANSKCDTYTCVSAKFISKNGCATGFYAAVNFLDAANGSVIGYTNATLPSLFPMQIAVLRFDDTSDSAKSVQMSTIKCY